MKILDLADFSNELKKSGIPPSPGIEIIDNAFIQGKYAAGYSISSGQLIPSSVMLRGNPFLIDKRISRELQFEKDSFRNSISVDCACIIPMPFEGGNHFGHLITEIISRLYSLLLHSKNLFPHTPIYIGEIFWERSSSIHRKLYKLFNIRVLKTNQNLVVKTLFIPKPSIYNRCSISREHCNALKTILPLISDQTQEIYNALEKSHDSLKTQSIYLSRSRLPSSKRRIVNERKLEFILENNGWTIVHPQELTLLQQIKLISESMIVAGSVGSAFHLLMALGYKVEENLPKVCMISKSRIELFNFIMQFQMQQIDATFLVDCLSYAEGNNVGEVNRDLLIKDNCFDALLESILGK